MPIYISCDYCGKKIATLPHGSYHRDIRDLPEGFQAMKLLDGAFVCPEDATQFPNGIFCSKKSYDELKDCFVALETETQNVLARSVG